MPFLPPEKNLPKGQTFYMFGRSRYDISHPGGMIDYDRISYLFNPSKHNLLINSIYWGYNPLTSNQGTRTGVPLTYVYPWYLAGVL